MPMEHSITYSDRTKTHIFEVKQCNPGENS